MLHMDQTIHEVLTEAQDLFKKANIENYKLDAQILLFHVLNIDKIDLIKNPNKLIKQEQIIKFQELVQLHVKHKPVSKLIGNREFYSLNYYVNEDVLDPRPDSEILIDTTLKYFQDKTRPISILDIGTGSGCLAITLLTLFPNANTVAVDISSFALNVAIRNAKKHQILHRINFIESDLFKNIKDIKFDLIISNPPYIESSNINSLDTAVRDYDPTIALDGGDNGLDFYYDIATQAQDYLTPNGKIILEIGNTQKKSVTTIFEKNNFILLESIKDYGQQDRCLIFTYQHPPLMY